MATEHKPSFTREQIINVTDIQRNWRKTVEPKLAAYPFVLLFSGSDPKATFLDYEKFEELWELAEEASELKLKFELISRWLSRNTGEKPLVTLEEILAKTGITASEVEEAPDVELE